MKKIIKIFLLISMIICSVLYAFFCIGFFDILLYLNDFVYSLFAFFMALSSFVLSINCIKLLRDDRASNVFIYVFFVIVLLIESVFHIKSDLIDKRIILMEIPIVLQPISCLLYLALYKKLYKSKKDIDSSMFNNNSLNIYMYFGSFSSLVINMVLMFLLDLSDGMKIILSVIVFTFSIASIVFFKRISNY